MNNCRTTLNTERRGRLSDHVPNSIKDPDPRCTPKFFLPTLILFAIYFAATAPAQAPPPMGPMNLNILPQQFNEVGIDQKLDAQVPPELVFRDESGNPVHLSQYFNTGRPIILTLVYFKCPMLCTMVLNDTLHAMNIMPLSAGKQFDVLTVSFNPDEKSDLAAAKKQEYLRHYPRPGADQGWHFLTGDPASIAQLTKAVGFRYKFDQTSQQYVHASGIVILTPHGRISRYFFGIDYQPNDLRLALLEASHGSIGSLTDQVLLYCYHFDPATGKYGVAISRLLKLFGGITIVALGSLLTILMRMDRRRHRANNSLQQRST